MIQAVGIGLLTGGIVVLPKMLHVQWPSFFVSSPALLVGIGLLAMALQKGILNRFEKNSPYTGIADLLIYIHDPAAQLAPVRWLIHGVLSFLLTLSGGVVGSEGAAIELAQAFQVSINAFSSRWFEQKRRTQVASILASAVAAAFGAPFAGLLLCFELGIGGRNLLAAISALVALMWSRFLHYQFSLPFIELHRVAAHFYPLDWRDWAGVLLVAVLSGGVGSGLIVFTRYAQESLTALFPQRAWMRMGVAIGLLLCIRAIGSNDSLLSENILESALWSKYSAYHTWLLFFMQWMTIPLLIAGVGTVGWLWPLLTLGGLLGCGIFQSVPSGWMSFSPAVGLAAAVSFWGVVLDAPIAGAVLVFELTQNIQFLLPVLVTGLVAVQVRKLFGLQSLVAEELRVRGYALYLGRSTVVMNSMSVQQAMVTDFVPILGSETLIEVQQRVLRSPYPFLPVVSHQGKFQGLLTADVLILRPSEADPEESRMGKVVEAKDLVYQKGVKTPVVPIESDLKSVIHYFDEFPCLPVVQGDQHLVGLLFVSDVRLAYDREVSRRSFDFMPKDKK